MAYIKTIWEDYPNTSTPITADDLNNIEDGIEALDTGKVNVSDIVDNLTSTDATKVLSAKQGKELDNRLANLEYDAVWTMNKSSVNSGWIKMMRIETTSAHIIRIIGISSFSSISGRGHFELLIGTGTNNERCESIIKTNGLTTASFDYRLVSPGVYEIWFYIPQYTYYYMKAYSEYGSMPQFTTGSVLGTPSGTVLTVG